MAAHKLNISHGTQNTTDKLLHITYYTTFPDSLKQESKTDDTKKTIK